MATAAVREYDVETLTPEEALRQETQDLFIDDGAEVTVSPEHREYSRFFSRVKARTIADLQTLGFVPRGIAEEHLKAAITKDDAAALQTARELVSRSNLHDCECTHAASHDQLPYRDQLARSYSTVRRAHHPALAELLSRHYKSDFRWDSVRLQTVRGWVSRASRLAAEGFLFIALFQDIRIGKNAKLVLAPSCTSLYARGIYIHRTGTLVHKGSYLNIWASSIQRWEDWGSIVVKQKVPWMLAI